MEIESVAVGSQSSAKANVTSASDKSGNSVKVVKATDKVVTLSNDGTGENSSQNADMEVAIDNKKVAQSTIDSTMSEINSKIKISNTQLKYSIDDETQRISIKVIDQDTDKVIREIPPEETLEAIKKIWEIAGIIVDEKL